MKYYVIAGEKSGDLHASNLVKSILAKDHSASFRFIGGDELSIVLNAKPLFHYSEMAYMGFVEVALHLRSIFAFIKKCKRDIQVFQPDAVILIDSAGFNMKIAKFCKELGIQTHFYIAPKIWAWNQKRALKMKAYVDHLYTILPFEPEFYAQFDYKNVDYVGNPLMDAIATYKNSPAEVLKFDKPILAVLPGSRKYELAKMLPKMMQAVEGFKSDYHIVIAGVDNVDQNYYKVYQNIEGVTIINNRTYQLLSSASLAVVTSGTAALETALFRVPQVICYEMSTLTALIVKRLIKVRFVTLVNLIMDKEICVELLQENFTPRNVILELNKLHKNLDNSKSLMVENYKLLQDKVGGSGASQKAGDLIYERVMSLA